MSTKRLRFAVARAAGRARVVGGGRVRRATTARARARAAAARPPRPSRRARRAAASRRCPPATSTTWTRASTYYTFGYQVGYSVNRPLYYFSPEDSSKQIPDIADGEPDDRRRRQVDDDQAQAGRQVLAAGQPRGQVRRHQVRLRARVQRERPERATRRSTSATSSARRRSRPRASRTSRASPARTTTTIEFKLTTPTAGAVYAALVMPITMPVPRGVRVEVRQDEPVDVRRARRLHRPVHGQERQRPAS